MLKNLTLSLEKDPDIEIELKANTNQVCITDGESHVYINKDAFFELADVAQQILAVQAQFTTQLALPAPSSVGSPQVRETEKPLTAPPRYTPPAKPSSPISYGPDEPNRDHPLDKAIQPPEPTTEMLITLDGVLQSYVVIQMAHGFIGPNNSVVDIASAQLFPNSEDTQHRAAQLGGVTKPYPEVGRYRVMYIDMLTREPTWLLDAAVGDTTSQRKDALTFIGREASFTFGQRHIPSAGHRMHVIPCTGAYA
jgi:hypothetical protein